jgi:hypothetical protein
MRKDNLRKFYDRLTPEERFRLYIEAIARGDEEEWRNLEKSCPRLVYEMNDRAYEDRVRASEEITVLVCLDLATRLAKLRCLWRSAMSSLDFRAAVFTKCTWPTFAVT